MLTLDRLHRLSSGHQEQVIPIEAKTENNTDYRRVLWTGEHLQVVVMALKPREFVGWEVHEDSDQFIRLEEGSLSVLGLREQTARAGDAVVIPAGIRHKIVAGPRGAKVYTIYAPPHHPWDTVQRSKPAND